MKDFDFEPYLKKIEKLADEIRQRYQAADKAVADAQTKLDRLPHGGPFSVEAAKRGVASAELRQAADDKARLPRQVEDDTRFALDRLREKLEDELIGIADADPKAVDQNGVTLLSSGILTAGELSRLYHSYEGNITMCRLVAAEAGERLRGPVEIDPADRQVLTDVMVESRQLGGDRFRNDFRVLSDIVLRMSRGSWKGLRPLLDEALAEMRREKVA